MNWIEVSKELGAELWSVYRKAMIPGGFIHVHETFSDHYGERGRPTMMTVVGVQGGASLLRLETTWDNEPVFDNETGFVVFCWRRNEQTRFWLPTNRDDS